MAALTISGWLAAGATIGLATGSAGVTAATIGGVMTGFATSTGSAFATGAGLAGAAFTTAFFGATLATAAARD
jgi:hypothetical protein